MTSSEKLQSKVRGWIQGFFCIDTRLVLVKHVLAAMPVFQMSAIVAPIWLSKAMDKIGRLFLWAEGDVAPGRKCLVKWITVCRPKLYSMLDMQTTSEALRVCWLWQPWTEPGKHWHGRMASPSPSTTRSRTCSWHRSCSTCGMAISSCSGLTLSILVPTLFQACTRDRLTIAQALDDHRWTRQLKRDLSPLPLA